MQGEDVARGMAEGGAGDTPSDSQLPQVLTQPGAVPLAGLASNRW